MGDRVEVIGPRYCDFCEQDGIQVLAAYDGATQYGPWANMCEKHFKVIGVGLGTGKGQRLIYIESDPQTGEASEQKPTTNS